MKYILILLFCFSISCVKQIDTNKPIENVSNLTSIEYLDVIPDANKIAVVYSNNYPIATTNTRTYIAIPKSSVIDILQLTEDQFNELDLKMNHSEIWQTVMFEDSKTGDYDYNDLIIQCKYEVDKTDKDAISLSIHPVALGSSKVISLGYDIYQDDILVESEVLFNNVRESLFDNKKGFLNTFSYNFESPGFKHTITLLFDKNVNHGHRVSVNWFILTGTFRFNALSTVYTTNMLDNNSRPYGVVITDERGFGFNYPKETINISEAYPDFGAWIEGKYSGDFKNMQTNDSKLVFDCVTNKVYY